MKFTPILQPRVWGGDRLIKGFGKELPKDDEGNPVTLPENGGIGESWEISAMGEDRVSEVSEGYLAGNPLDDILETYLGDLVGDNIFDYYNMQFPLLVKLLDVEEYLSVQVHPDDDTAAERFEDFGKNECWHIMEASENATVYMGFKRDVTAGEFYEKCKDGTVKELLNEYHPKAGESFFIPAGTVHACGGGLVIAEVQEPSDITFRLYDWGRENNPATARAMHLEEAIDCIDYRKYDDALCHTLPSASSVTIADCESFTASVVRTDKPVSLQTEDFNSCIVFICTEGSATFRTEADKAGCSLNRGETILIPANSDDFTIIPAAGGVTLLEAHIRKIEERQDDYINEGTEATLPEEKDDDGYYKN